MIVTTATDPPTAREAPGTRRDLVDGACWLALGLAILVGSWRMDRLEAQGINPYTAPGLVPGLLGIAMALFAVVMIGRGLRGRLQAGGQADAAAPAAVADPPEGGRGRGRLATVLALCIAFAVGLVGRGSPFWLAAALFVTTSIVALRFRELREAGRLGRGIAVALAIGLSTGVVVTLVFEKFFYVRLP